MKFFDYKCYECGNILEDVIVPDGEDAPKTKKCPECGKMAKQVFGAIPGATLKHQAVKRRG
jgi:putative FmdB family regulatory protein